MPVPGSNRELLFLLLFSFVVLGLGIGLRSPWPADEPRFAQIALEMIQRMEELGRNVQDSDSSSMLIRCYFSGLTASGLARRTRRQKYFSMTRKFVKEMQQLTAVKGHCLTFQKQLLMEAELLSLGRHKTAKVQKGYAAAIEAALKTGHINDAALGNELAGEYLLSKGEEDLARDHFTEARNMYQQWGALAKVHHLKMKRSKFLHTSKQVPTPTGKWIHGKASDFQSKLSSHRGTPIGTRSTDSSVSGGVPSVVGSILEISEHSPI